MNEDFWEAGSDRVQSERPGRSGVVNVALLFGTAMIALALVIPPMVDGSSDKRRLAFEPEEFDNITTGSIGTSEGTKRYTIRRSVLQETPGSVCIVEGYGAGGDC